MMLRRCLSIALTFLLCNPIWASPLFAQLHGGWKKYSPGQLQAAMNVLGSGQESHITVKLLDKTVLSGYVTEIEPAHFLVMDTRTTRVFPVRYRNVKELRAENAENGVQFAARVSSHLNLEMNGESPDNSPAGDCCNPKGDWIAALVGIGFVAVILILLAAGGKD
jgi:hypothetical protein